MALGGRRQLVRIATVVGLLVLGSLVLTPPAPAARTYQLKACINAKTSAVRVVVKSTKCKSTEAYVDLFTSVTTINSVLSGPVAPVDDVIGRDGDFYVDNVKKLFYGPRVGGKWGPPINIVGAQGPKGDPGPAGPTGSSGSPGPAGPSGAAGAPGAAGAAGAPGAAGAAGADGRTILSGSTAPANTIGSNGDFYIDTVANQIYGPKSGSGWGSGTSIIGPKGDTGSVGATGPKGETGAAGGYGAYGSFYDTSTVPLTNAATTYVVPLSQTAFARGISMTSNGSTLTRVTMANSGYYNIAFSLQIQYTPASNSNAVGSVTIWLRKNGSDVEWTATDVYLTPQAKGTVARSVAAWNFFVQASAANDYWELAVSADNTGTVIFAGDPDAYGPPNLARPKIPSTILTVNQVG